MDLVQVRRITTAKPHRVASVCKAEFYSLDRHDVTLPSRRKALDASPRAAVSWAWTLCRKGL